MDICGVIDSVKTNAGFAEQQKVNFSGTVLSIVNSFFLLYFVKKKVRFMVSMSSGEDFGLIK